MKSVRGVGVCAAAAFLLACQLGELPTHPATIEGVVTSIDNVAMSVLVEEDPLVSEPTAPGGKKMRLDVTRASIYVRRPDGTAARGEFEQIALGVRVKAWMIGGDVPSSGIPKVAASDLEILGG